MPRNMLLAPVMLALLWAHPGAAGHPLIASFGDEPAAAFEVVNGSLEADAAVLRWRPNPGQTSQLALRPDHPLFGRLRYYDQCRFEYRIAAGEINSMSLNALGHVSGPRQYKVHSWKLGLVTTKRGVWHQRELDLARPNWFPWDKADGPGAEAFFRFEAIALLPGTVIELRRLRLSRSLLILKPDYELPVTWPVLTAHEDGAATYQLEHRVLNASGRPTTVKARITSPHTRFRVAILPGNAPVAAVAAKDAPLAAEVEVKNGKTARFTVLATLTAPDIAATPELYAETLSLAFAPAHEPEVNVAWRRDLVRPLSGGVQRQVVLAPAELARIRRGTAENDAELLKALDGPATLQTADGFVATELVRIPSGHGHVRNNWTGNWRVGKRMPEAVETVTGEVQFDTFIAARTWKEYLSMRGQGCESLMRAYLFTGDEKYARKALELFRLYAQQYKGLHWFSLFDPPWNRGPANLSSTRTAGASTYGSNWYFKGHCRLLSAMTASSSWQPEDWQAVYEGFVLPYATELVKFPGGINNRTDITNHNILLLGLAFRDAHMVRWALRHDAGLVRRLSDLDADGFSSEGRPLNYHYAAMAEYLPSIAYLDNSRLATPYPKERLLAAIRMPYQRAMLTGRVPAAGDCGRGQSVGNTAHADHLIGIFPGEDWLFDIGRMGSISKKLMAHKKGRRPERYGWKALLETGPRLFRHAGLAILRSGATPAEQVMATLDYGRNLAHAHRDRNQVTLGAFGKVFTHGPGTLYNVGSGGMTRNRHAQLDRFVGSGSLGQNVVLVDQLDQLPAVGELIAWSDKPQFQVAAGRVAGIQPGVTHTRALVLTQGLVLVFDRIAGEREHSFDFVYHNFGQQTLGPGWRSEPVTQPLGETANYDNIVEARSLAGEGPINLSWDLTGEVSSATAAKAERAGTPLPAAHLALWQLPVKGGAAYIGKTGMNNPNTMTIPDATSSLFHRVRGRTAVYVTVLEPHRGTPRVAAIRPSGKDGVTVVLTNGKTIQTSLSELLASHGVEPR